MPAKKQIKRDMILQAALTLLRRKGFEAVTVKSLAKTLHCSTQPIYLSFASMEELRKELLPMAIETFQHFMKKESQQEQICLFSMEYIQFAKQEPKLFHYLFMRSNAFHEIKQILLPVIEQSIEIFMQDYQISHEEADLLHDHLWMHAHGIATMIATEFCDWDFEKVEHMLNESRKAFTMKFEV